MNHQPGPLIAFPVPYDRLKRYSILGPSSAVNGLREEIAAKVRREGNARLLAAAYTSYDKHFGAMAVEVAEGDWIGRAVALLRDALDHDTPSHICHEINKLLQGAAQA